MDARNMSSLWIQGQALRISVGRWRAILGITIDENTPFLPVATASNVVLNPLVTLKSVRVEKAEAEDVDVLISNLPGGMGGLLGNSFLHKFRVVLDPGSGKMTLFSLQGQQSPDRPGGYGKDYWVSRFQFYHTNLERLNTMKAEYERRDSFSEKPKLNRIVHAIQYFENQLNELERKASFSQRPPQLETVSDKRERSDAFLNKLRGHNGNGSLCAFYGLDISQPFRY